MRLDFDCEMEEGPFPAWLDRKACEQEKRKMIYLDNAATTYPKPECVLQAVDYGNRVLAVNAGRGFYRLAQVASEGIEAVRSEILNLISGQGEADVVLTASATLAFNEIIGGLMLSQRDRVYVSPFEHNAVMRTLWIYQKKCGCSIEQLPMQVDKMEIDLDKMDYLFREKPPAYVFITHISNVTGYVLPVEEIYKKAKEVTAGRAVVILDGAQSFGLVNIDYRKTPFDGIVFAGHKTLYGPFGVAGFVWRKGLALNPYLGGGTGSDSLNMEMPGFPRGFEPGSPNMPAVMGLYAALQYRKKGKAEDMAEHEKRLTEYLITRLGEIPEVNLYVPKTEDRRMGIVSFTVDGYRSDEIGMLMDEDYHIAVRTGYHCVPLVHRYLGDEEYGGTVRVSVGWFNDEGDVKRVVECVREILEG